MPLRNRSRWRYLSAISFSLVALGSNLFAAPDAGKSPFAFHDMNILGTSMDLQVTVATQAEADKVHATVLAEIERLRKILSTYDPASDISKVNASKDPVKVPQEVIDVLKLYETWQTKSKGNFTAGTGELITLWTKAEKDGHAPDVASLTAAVAKLNKPLFKIDDAAKTVQRLTDVPLNIDSLGKGFIADRAAQLARKEHSLIRGIMLNIGGDIVALGGSTTTGAFTPWTVGVADPDNPADNAPPLVEVKITAAAVATSGNYSRTYKIGEKKYSHVLNPHTGQPVDFKETKDATVDAATVIAPDNATANALAATLCVMSPADGLALIRTVPDAHCLLLLSDGSQERSAGFKKYEVAEAATAHESTPATPAATPAAATPATPPANVGSGSIAKGSAVDIPLQINAVSASNPRPYVGVWIETDKGEYVKTLAIYGNERKYFISLKDWWKRWAQKDSKVGASVTKATKPPGKYPLTWDGTNEKGEQMPKGVYSVYVATAFWRGGQLESFTKIACGDTKTTASVPGNGHIAAVPITYTPAKGN